MAATNKLQIFSEICNYWTKCSHTVLIIILSNSFLCTFFFVFSFSTSGVYLTDFYTNHQTPPLFLISFFLFNFFPVRIIFTYLRQDLDRFYFFLPPASSGMNTLTVKSPLSVPYLFFTRMLYLPESDVFTPVMVKLANLPDSNFRMQCSSDVISLSFFSQVTSGTGLPEMLQVRLRACMENKAQLSYTQGSHCKG